MQPQYQINKEEINNILEAIDSRNNQIMSVIQEERREFDEKAEKILSFVKMRNKIERFQIASSLMIPSEEVKRIQKLTKETGDELYKRALEKSNGDEKKAISLLFSSSDDVFF